MDTVCNGEMARAANENGLVGIIHRFQSIPDQRYQVEYALHTEYAAHASNIGFAVGVSGDYQKRLAEVLHAWREITWITPWICFDTANGFTSQMEKAFTWYKNNLAEERHITIAGNVASAEGYTFLSDLGVDVVRVGLGSGSPCTTSVVTGCGAGMVSAIQECHYADKPALILADGGIRAGGDIIKALAVGANMVMCGSLFAGLEESPGKVQDGFKIFRGMASQEAANDLGKIQGEKIIIPEGITHKVPYRGSVHDFIPRLMGELKIGMSYLNSRMLSEFRDYFIRHPDSIEQLTPSSFLERRPHIYA